MQKNQVWKLLYGELTMRIIETKRYYLENEDKKKIKVWLIQKEMTLVGLADELGISLSLLGAIMNGTRAISIENIAKLKVMGLQLLGEN